MNIIYIDSKPIFSNEEIHITIKYILKNEVNSIDKLQLIVKLVRYISDEKLLKNTIELLNIYPIFQETIDKLMDLDKYLESQLIKDESDKTILKASIYSISFFCRILLNQFEMYLKNSQIPELKFNVNNRTLEYNLTEITDLIKKRPIGIVRDEILDLPKTKDQELEFKKLIQSFELIDYDNSTEYFQKEIKHFESIKNNLTPTINSEQSDISRSLTKNIFNEDVSIENFNDYLKLHIVEPYVDYSYLFQRMLDENIIVKIKHLEFTNWLHDNHYISENIKDLIIKNNGFRSLKKSFSSQRENNFNNLFNL